MKNKFSIIVLAILCMAANTAYAEGASTVNNKTNKIINFFKFNNHAKAESKVVENQKNRDEQSTVFSQDATLSPEVKAKKKKFSVKILHKKAETQDNIKTNATVEKPVEESNSSFVHKKLERVKEEKSVAKKNSQEVIQVNATKKIIGTISTDKIISVDDCVKLALTYNPSIRSAMSTSDIYKTKIAQAWSAYFPTFGLDANYSRNDMLITNFAFPGQTYSLYNMPKVTAQMLLFDFGKTKAAADMSKRTYEASQSNVQMSINDVIFNVKKSYFNLLFAMQQADVYAQTVKDYELHLKQAEAFYRIGTKAKIDVTTAEYGLGKAKLNYIKAKNNISLVYAQLSNAIGLPEFANFKVADKLDTRSYKVNFDEIISTAYDTRPELLAAKKKSDASKILVKASVRAFAPDVTAFGNYTLGGKTPANDHGYQLGAGLTYKTTNLMLLRKQVDEAKATYNRDLADYENVRQSVYLQVKQAYIDLYNAQDSVPVARLSMKQAKQQYELASGRYKVGLGDAIELKDAENTYRSAQLDYYSTLLDYNVAAANIERVIGAPVKASKEALL